MTLSHTEFIDLMTKLKLEGAKLENLYFNLAAFGETEDAPLSLASLIESTELYLDLAKSNQFSSTTVYVMVSESKLISFETFISLTKMHLDGVNAKALLALAKTLEDFMLALKMMAFELILESAQTAPAPRTLDFIVTSNARTRSFKSASQEIINFLVHNLKEEVVAYFSELFQGENLLEALLEDAPADEQAKFEATSGLIFAVISAAYFDDTALASFEEKPSLWDLEWGLYRTYMLERGPITLGPLRVFRPQEMISQNFKGPKSSLVHLELLAQEDERSVIETIKMLWDKFLAEENPTSFEPPARILVKCVETFKALR